VTLDGETGTVSLRDSGTGLYLGRNRALRSVSLSDEVLLIFDDDYAVPAQHLAQLCVYGMLDDKEQASRRLEKACEDSNGFPLLMNSDPFYDPLR
jgi:hypothetical protein